MDNSSFVDYCVDQFMVTPKFVDEVLPPEKKRANADTIVSGSVTVEIGTIGTSFYFQCFYKTI